MPKNRITGISEKLKAQAQERFNPTIENKNQDHAPANEVVEKIRKNFYIETRLVKLLRKMAYEEETDQTKIVNEALEAFFKAKGYTNDT